MFLIYLKKNILRLQKGEKKYMTSAKNFFALVQCVNAVQNFSQWIGLVLVLG